MTKQKKELVVLAVLLVLMVVAYYLNSSGTASISNLVASDAAVHLLSVEDPALRLDLLERIKKLEYSGAHRNIFSATAPPIEVQHGNTPHQPGFRKVGPELPPPPPPLQVPVTFFGYASDPATGSRRAFFTSGDDVYVLAEGETLLNRYRLIHIGNNSAEFEEIASGQRGSVPLVEAPENPQ